MLDKLAVSNECQESLSSQVGARLQLFWRAWERYNVEPWVMEVVKEGYQIPFLAPPPLSVVPQEFPAYLGNQEKFLALETEVKEMFQKGAIEQVIDNSPGYYNRLFLVLKASGAWRPVLDVSSLNKFVKKTKFSMETTQSVLSAIHQDDWMISMDMKDAYFHIPIHPASRPYLRFMFNGLNYQFKALCFGLSTAPQVFTRVLAPLARICHLAGIRIILYLDDWLVLAKSLEEMRLAKKFILDLAQELGIVINYEKSVLEPAQVANYLGMKIDSRTFWASPLEKRVTATLKTISEFRASSSQPAKLWMKLLGHMSSLEKFIPGARLRMRPFQFALQKLWNRAVQSDKTLISISQDLLQELSWWDNKDRLIAGISLLPKNPDLALFSDASRTGWGATVASLHLSGNWALEEKQLHINNLELRAIWYALKETEHLVAHKIVSVFSDNTTALAYLVKQGGTKSLDLYLLVRQILLWAEERGICLLPQFVSGVKNVTADTLSRKGQAIPTEWTLNMEVCQQLWRLWGQPSVDLFATKMTRRLPIYMSPHLDEEALAVDAMLQSWCNMDVYAFPPFALIRDVINKFKRSYNCRMTLVAPWWPQREWFPDLVELLVDRPRLLPLRQDLLSQPVGRLLHPNLPTLQLTGWRLSSVSEELRSYHTRSIQRSILLGGHRPTTCINIDGPSTSSGVGPTTIQPPGRL